MKESIEIVDMFCGAGGESTGIMQAANERGMNIHMTAINHWERAIETHSANFPNADHLCESVEHLDPMKVVPGGHLGLLWASPECTHHSNARGGRPRDNQSRSSAWNILKWAQELYIERIIIENVPEFLSWGPLDEHGIPIKEHRGETFNAFLAAMKSLGYSIEWQLLCAADYNVPTTRKRLFVQCVRGDKKIIWPKITNYSSDSPNLLGLKPYRTAEEVIDFSIKGESIYNRNIPLAKNTMKRIENGMRKFWGKNKEPFIIKYYGSGENVESINKPLATITTKERFGLVEGDPVKLDIRLRMLQPKELSAAQGFPSDYKFTGTKTEIVKQIGNAVCPGVSKALCKSYFNVV